MSDFWEKAGKSAGPDGVFEGFTEVAAPGSSTPLPVFVRASGTRGPALLCVHGFGDNLHSWSALRTHLADADRRVVALDLPGFGRTPLPPGFAGAYSLRAVELVGALARELGPEKIVLAGNSMGGAIGLGAAARDAAAGGSRFGGLLLVAPATPSTRTPHFLRLLRLPAYRWADGLSRRLARGPRRAAAELVARVGFRTVLAPGRRPSAEWFDSVARSFERPGAFLDLERVARDLRAVLRGEAEGIREIVAGTERVTAPVTVLRGSLDRVISRRELEELARRLPHGRYVELDGVAHCPQNEAVSATAELARELLEGRPFPGSGGAGSAAAVSPT